MKTLASVITLLGYVASPGGVATYAVAETPAVKQTSAKKKTAAPVKQKVQAYSPYSSNPEYDVYVNGDYVGSDPDPRIRWQIRREATGKQESNDRGR